jgi:uncharacterized protein YdhG (YjbR/CyaY superfamily)
MAATTTPPIGPVQSPESPDVDDYIAAAPTSAQPKLRQLRRAIRRAAPQATERISYGMPFYELEGRLVYFAGYKRHVALYAAGHVNDSCAESLARYRTPKGTLRFPIDEPLPEAEIGGLVQFRAKENEGRAISPPTP